MEDVAEDVRARWEREVVYFVRALTLAQGKRLVLKSPPHTGRIRILSQLFPGAKFIHIARHPETLFASTRRLWWTLYHVQGLQVPDGRELDEYIFECFERMYRGFQSQRSDIDPAHLCDVRYEDLVRDPIRQVAGIYEQLDLGDFERVRADLEACVRERHDYQPNLHQEIEPEVQAEIRRRWSGYYERYGYDPVLARS
jgi:omega-hydroxy-beta-dihydromenaquinone-9 sulfotransferase